MTATLWTYDYMIDSDSQILFIDKPKGVTSYDVIRRLKPKFPRMKIGHAGTLDPLASGLMIVAVGSATKQLTQFLKLPKRYIVEATFGKISATYDAEGPFTEIVHESVSREAIIENLREHFTGEILQTPPAYSAAKINGQRAYDLARQGREVVLESRKISIESCEILSYEWPRLSLDVRCSSGTYIRSLVHDLGQKLGCGAYVSDLRRIEIGEYHLGLVDNLRNYA